MADSKPTAQVTQANEKVPNQERNAVVLGKTLRHSQIVAGGKLGARSVTQEASPTRRVGAIGRVELFILDVVSEHCNMVVVTPTGNCQLVSAEV